MKRSASKVVPICERVIVRASSSCLAVACLAVFVGACSKQADCPDAGARAASIATTTPAPAKSVISRGSDSGRPVTDDQLRKRLGESLVTPEAYEQLIVQASGVLAQALASSNQPELQLTAEKLAVVVTEALPREEVSAITADVYKRRFTREELEALVAFYESKAGAKLVKQQTEMGQDVGGRVSRIVTQRWPKLAQKHGLDVGK